MVSGLEYLEIPCLIDIKVMNRNKNKPSIEVVGMEEIGLGFSPSLKFGVSTSPAMNFNRFSPLAKILFLLSSFFFSLKSLLSTNVVSDIRVLNSLRKSQSEMMSYSFVHVNYVELPATTNIYGRFLSLPDTNILPV